MTSQLCLPLYAYEKKPDNIVRIISHQNKLLSIIISHQNIQTPTARTKKITPRSKEEQNLSEEI